MFYPLVAYWGLHKCVLDLVEELLHGPAVFVGQQNFVTDDVSPRLTSCISLNDFFECDKVFCSISEPFILHLLLGDVRAREIGIAGGDEEDPRERLHFLGG